MPNFSRLPVLEFWYHALRSEVGIVIETEPADMERVRQLLYVARREANDPDLAQIEVCFSPSSSGQIWLIKESARVKGLTL